MVQVPEGRCIFGRLTVRRTCSWARTPAATGARSPDQGRSWAVPAPGERAQLAGTLSGGEQQMLAMARALMARPRAAAAGRATGAGAAVVAGVPTIRRLKAQGATILLVEQNAPKALGIATRLRTESGRIVPRTPRGASCWIMRG